jgi:hypothetical protein
MVKSGEVRTPVVASPPWKLPVYSQRRSRLPRVAHCRHANGMDPRFMKASLDNVSELNHY